MNPSKEPDSEVFSQVLTCTFSAEEYSIYSKTIFNKISENSSDYDEAFLLSIQEILSSKTYAPSSKFYALLLLVKASESENDTLIKQLSNARDLLNILFLEAQTDRNKPLKEKGKHLFKVNSTEEEMIIGNNYMILLLEVFDYWFRAFGRANKKDPGHVFFVIFKNLSRSIMFPTVYTYVGENLQINGDFHLIPNKNQGTISPIKGQDRSELESTEAFTQLITCIASEEDYKAYSRVIFDTVSTEDKEYNKNLFLAFTEILGKTSFSFVLKFYALYLLVKLTETGNKTFITQFAQSTKLLNQIYKLAKDSGTLTGPTILPSLGPNDSEIQHRNKFNVLILEAVKYWHLTYGDPDPSRTAHNFTNMVDALGKWVLLPEEFTYIQTQAQAQGNEGESLEILENNNVGLLRQQNQPESYYQETQDFLLNKMQNCVSSGLTFRDNYRTFAEELLLDLTQGDRFLQETLEILSSTEYTPSSKFYTLYLLVKVTELAENDFMVMLAKTQKLMSKFFEDAQFDKHKVPEQKGMTFFGRKIETNNGIIASNYLQLLSEAIHFWGQVFSVDDRKDNRHVFKLMSEQLMKMTKVEPQQYYIGRDLDQIETQLMARFELTPFKSLPLTQEKELESIQNGEILEESIKTKPEPVPIKGEDNRHNKTKHKDPETIKRDMEIRLEKLRESKRKLREFLQEEKQENQATRNNLEHFYQQVLRNYHDDVIKLGGSLLITHHKDKNDLLEAFHKEGEVTEQLQKDYSDYTTRKITYSELRRRMLLLLSDGKESPEKSLSEPKSSKSTKSLKKHKKKEGQPKVRFQKFYACDMLDDEDSPRSIQSRISSSQSKRLEAAANKENPILSPTSPLLKEEALLGGYFSKPSLQTVPKVLELRDSKEFNKEKEKITLEIREHQTPEYLSKSPIHRNSLGATPKNFETDLEKLEQNIRMSKSKIDSLADMEESIKHSFKAQGREPPGFKSVVNMEYTSALQEEIVKLKKEREDLLRENEVLKSRTETVVNIDVEERETSQIEDMKSLLSDYQKKIDTIQQQLEDSSSPRRKLSRQSPELQIGHLQNSVSLNNINIKSGHITPTSHLESVITPKNKSEVDPQFKTSILDHFLYSSSYVRQSVDLETQRRDFNNQEKPKSSLGNSQSHHILRSSNYLMKAEPFGTSKVESQSQFATRKSSLNVIEDQRNNKDHYQSTFLNNNSLARSQALLSRNSLAKSLIYTNERNLGGSAAIYTELDKFVSPKAKVWNEGLEYASKDRIETVVFETHRDRDAQRGSFFDNSSGNGNGRSDHNNLRKSYKPPEYRSNLLAGLKLRILDMSSAQNAMFNYKLSCLRRSGVLYEDKNLRIEASTNIIDDQYDPESVLIINLHYSNKGYDKLSNLRVDFPEISNANIESQPKIEYVLLQPGQEVSQQVFFSFKEWPLQVPQLFGNYKTARFREDFSLFLPTLITNFMNFRAMDVVSFEREFKLAENVVDSDEIEIDHFIVQNPIDFQKYFPGLMDLNMLKRPEMVGVHDREITFGGVFRINWTPKDYFLKIRVFDVNKVIFSIATKEESCNFVDILLETLGFLFGRD